MPNLPISWLFGLFRWLIESLPGTIRRLKVMLLGEADCGIASVTCMLTQSAEIERQNRTSSCNRNSFLNAPKRHSQRASKAFRRCWRTRPKLKHIRAPEVSQSNVGKYNSKLLVPPRTIPATCHQMKFMSMLKDSQFLSLSMARLFLFTLAWLRVHFSLIQTCHLRLDGAANTLPLFWQHWQ